MSNGVWLIFLCSDDVGSQVTKSEVEVEYSVAEEDLLFLSWLFACNTADYELG